MRRLAILAIVGLAAIGCGTDAAPSEGSDAPLVLAVPTVKPINAPPGVAVGCAGVGLDAVLHGDPRDPRVTWLITSTGHRIDVVWPVGYHAVFAPFLAVVDAAGHTVLTEGARIEGGCVTDMHNVLLLEPPFR